jgi:hypothetical protein
VCHVCFCGVFLSLRPMRIHLLRGLLKELPPVVYPFSSRRKRSP